MNQSKARKGIYLLPNAITAASLFAGFYAIIAAQNGLFHVSAMVIFVAMLLDGADGRLARKLNSQSDFGAHFDSLTDLVTFGVAPALVVYAWTLQSLGKFGWLTAFFYTAAATLRLARFNTRLSLDDKRYFQGLSSTLAAGALMGFVWLGSDYAWSFGILPWLTAGLTVLLAMLMVSNLRYYSFKTLNLEGKVSFVWMLVVVLLYMIISLGPSLMLFVVCFIYALSGLVLTLWTKRQQRQIRFARKKRRKLSKTGS